MQVGVCAEVNRICDSSCDFAHCPLAGEPTYIFDAHFTLYHADGHIILCLFIAGGLTTTTVI